MAQKKEALVRMPVVLYGNPFPTPMQCFQMVERALGCAGYVMQKKERLQEEDSLRRQD